MQRWEIGLVKSVQGTDDPGCVLWTGGTSLKPTPRAGAVEGKHAEGLSVQPEQADHGCENKTHTRVLV